VQGGQRHAWVSEPLPPPPGQSRWRPALHVCALCEHKRAQHQRSMAGAQVQELGQGGPPEPTGPQQGQRGPRSPPLTPPTPPHPMCELSTRSLHSCSSCPSWACSTTTSLGTAWAPATASTAATMAASRRRPVGTLASLSMESDCARVRGVGGRVCGVRGRACAHVRACVRCTCV